MDQEQLKAAHKCLHQRGMRERCLHDTLERFMEYAGNSCTKNKKGESKHLSESH